MVAYNARMAQRLSIVTVCLNPAIDLAVEAPELQLGAHQKVRELSRVAGGKGVNVSRVLARLGVASVAMGFVGAENRRLFDELPELGPIEPDFVERPGRTRENITLTDPARHQDTHLRFAGLAVDGADLDRLAERLAPRMSAGVLAVFAGSPGPGVTPDRYVGLLRMCADAGARVIVDASGPALSAAVEQSPWLIKPNRAELAELAGRPLPGLPAELAACRELTGEERHVLLSRGAEGALLTGPDGAWQARVDLPAERVVNTVGCGDALLAGFLAGTVEQLDAPQALARAVAIASAAAAHPATAMFDDALARDLHRTVRIHPVDG